MSLIVKIMCADRGNDGHPRHGHRLFANVQEVEFEEPSNYHGVPRCAHVHLTFKRETEAAPEVTTSIALMGNVYVMNEGGKTISSFDVAPPQLAGVGLGDPTHTGQLAGALTPTGRAQLAAAQNYSAAESNVASQRTA
jgi:hypothetical protein